MVMPPKHIAVLGEHYLPDSELFLQTTEPRVMDRHLPTGLDVATALGSEAAARKLERLTVDFPQVVPAARDFGPRMAGDAVYGIWLDTLRALFDRPEGLRSRIRRLLDWERVTPVEEIGTGTWRNWAKRTLRQLWKD